MMLTITDNLFGFLIDEDIMIAKLDCAIRKQEDKLNVEVYDIDDSTLTKTFDITLHYCPLGIKGQVIITFWWKGERIGIVSLYPNDVVEPSMQFDNIVKVVMDFCRELQRKAHVTIA